MSIRRRNEAKAEEAKGKTMVSLVPPARILGEAKAFQAGLETYERDDWRKGGDWSQYYDAAMRHLLAFQSGEMLDPESGLPHLDHARASLSILQTWVEDGLGTDDRPVITEMHLKVNGASSPSCPHRVRSKEDGAVCRPGVPILRCESCGLWNDGVTITWKAYDEWVAK